MGTLIGKMESADAQGADDDDDEEEDDTFDLMMQELMGDLMVSPEAVKEMVLNECETDTVSTEPMLTMYHTIITDMNGALDANDAVPSSVTVCRPKLEGSGSRSDEAAVRCAATSSPFLLL